MAFSLQLYTFHNTEMTDLPPPTARATGPPTDPLASMVLLLLLVLCTLVVPAQAPLHPATAPTSIHAKQSSLQTLLTSEIMHNLIERDMLGGLDFGQ